VNQSFGPSKTSSSSLGSYNASKASASSSGTHGEYRMVPNRKSFHESALNCRETTLHLYSVFRTVLLNIDFFCLPRSRFPTTCCSRRQNLSANTYCFFIQDCQPSTELAVLPPASALMSWIVQTIRTCLGMLPRKLGKSTQRLIQYRWMMSLPTMSPVGGGLASCRRLRPKCDIASVAAPSFRSGVEAVRAGGRARSDKIRSGARPATGDSPCGSGSGCNGRVRAKRNAVATSARRHHRRQTCCKAGYAWISVLPGKEKGDVRHA